MNRKINYPNFVKKKEIKVMNYGFNNEKYRFLLSVPFDTNGNTFLRVIMKNPSVADEQYCDMTMLKVCIATYKAGYDGVVIMNLFPYRTTKAKNIYDSYYTSNRENYENSMRINKKIIKENCAKSNVVFAWGTNTINKRKEFDIVYNETIHDIIEVVGECAEGACIPCLTKDGKYPIHALRWWNDILVDSAAESNCDEKQQVLHHNMFGPSAEVCNTNPEDLSIFCYRENKICIPYCNKCEYYRGNEQGLGVACEWEDFEGNISVNESVIQNYEKTLEYDRVQYMKKCTQKKDVDVYMNWVVNYEK